MEEKMDTTTTPTPAQIKEKKLKLLQAAIDEINGMKPKDGRDEKLKEYLNKRDKEIDSVMMANFEDMVMANMSARNPVIRCGLISFCTACRIPNPKLEEFIEFLVVANCLERGKSKE